MSRANPEHKLSVAVREYLEYALPHSMYWTASLTGTHLSRAARVRAKAAGVRRGLPDFLFVFPDGVTRYIELKAKTGSLTPEQREFRDKFGPLGIFAVARSIDDVERALTEWKAPIRVRPTGWFGADMEHE